MATGFTGIFNTAYMPVPLSITGYGGPTGGNWMEWTVHANTLKAMGPTGATGTTMTLSVPSGGVIQATIGGTGAMVLTNSSVSVGQGAGAGAGSFGVNWSLTTSAPTNVVWSGVAMSSTGQYQTAVVFNGGIYTSSNYGVTWMLVPAANAAPTDVRWYSVAMSSTGQYQTAVINPGGLYTSGNYGGTWNLSSAPNTPTTYWYSVAMSSDGTRQTAVVTNGAIYTSTNSGGNWTAVTTSPVNVNLNWYSVAMSSTGQYQTAVVRNGGIYRSTDYGANWTFNTSAPTAQWQSVTMSITGQYQTAVISSTTSPGGIYRSIDSGVTWTLVPGANGAPTNIFWSSVTISSNGQYQTAVSQDSGSGKIYITNIFTSNNTYIGANTQVNGTSNEVVIGSGLIGAGSNTVSIGTNSRAYATFSTTGLVFNGGRQTIVITSASYDTSALIATLNYSSVTVTPLTGQWITVTGASVSGYNGTFIVITATSTSLTVQNYTATSLGTTNGIITIIGPTTQGLTFGDSSFKTTNRVPLTTIITSNSPVAGTPMAVGGRYTTPIGAKYLRVRMVGAGGGGNNYNSGIATPNAGIGGYTRFDKYIAYGGQVGIRIGNTYWSNSTYPYQCGAYQGGLGGGTWQATGYGTSTNIGSVNLDASVSNFFVSGYLPLAGQTITLNGFAPTNWNGTWTITSATTNNVYFSTPGLTLSAVSIYGMFVINQPDTNTIYIPGGQGGGGGYNFPSNYIGGAMGGCSALGPNAPGFFGANPAGSSTAQQPLPQGSYSFASGGGGQGGGGRIDVPGNGGGGGMYIETYISNPATSYTTLVGLGGQGGGGDTVAGSPPTIYRYNAAPGFNGVIIVDAFF